MGTFNSNLTGQIADDKVTGQRIVIVGGSTFQSGVRVRFPDGSTTTVSVDSLSVHPRPQPDPKPFYVYTRYYKANGDCEKRVHHFATRKAQRAFIRNTHRAVTAFN